MSRSPAQALDAAAPAGLVPGAGHATFEKPFLISGYPAARWAVRLPAPRSRLGYRWHLARDWRAALRLAAEHWAGR